MATEKAFVDYVLEQAALADALSYRKMFGEYALYLDGKVVALACDNSLFIKPSSAATELVPDIEQRPPYPGVKPFPVIDELLDEPERLRALLQATAAVLPMPKPKKPRVDRKRKALR